MKILLINPHFSNMTIDVPLGLAYIAAVAREVGCDVIVVDMDACNARVGDDHVLSTINEFNPDLIGISIYTDFARSAYALMKKMTKFHIPVVVGGPHPTVRPNEAFLFGASYVVRGEGEDTFRELLEHVKAKEPPVSVPGLSLVAGGKVVHNEGRKLIEFIDSIPVPAKDLFNIKDYSGRMGAEPFGGLLTSRGCPGRCVYCSNAVMGRKNRFRTPSAIMQEIRHLRDAYGIRKFTFVDDSFSADIERTSSLLREMIRERFEIEWTCFTRANYVNFDFLCLMKEAGCVAVDYGIEHGDDASLQKLRKGISVAMIENALGWTKKAGLRYTTNYILGFPWETEQTIKNTVSHAKSFHDIGLQTSPIVPYPGTELFESYKDEYHLDEWWLQRDGIRWQDIDSIAKGRPLSNIAFFRLSRDKEKLIQKGFQQFHAPHMRFAHESTNLPNPKALLYWVLRFLYVLSPGMERATYGAAKSIYSRFGQGLAKRRMITRA